MIKRPRARKSVDLELGLLCQLLFPSWWINCWALVWPTIKEFLQKPYRYLKGQSLIFDHKYLRFVKIMSLTKNQLIHLSKVIYSIICLHDIYNSSSMKKQTLSAPILQEWYDPSFIMPLRRFHGVIDSRIRPCPSKHCIFDYSGSALIKRNDGRFQTCVAIF